MTNNSTSLDSLQFTQDEATKRLREFVRNRIVSDSLEDEERITAYELYWQFYNGNHWRQYNRTVMSFNYVRAFIDKVSQFLIGNKAFSLRVSAYASDSVDKKIEQAAEKMLLVHWNRNHRLRLSYEMLQMGSVMGDLWIIPSWKVEEKFVHIHVADSRHCFPLFKDGDITDLESFTFRQPLVSNDKKYVVKITEYKKDAITTWYQRITSVKASPKEKFEVTVLPNALGFIPVVHVQNRPSPSRYFSTSDVEDVLKLNKTYNELAQELKGIIDYYVAPTTIVTGATVGNLTKKLGRVWSGLPPEANVFNLGLDVDLSAAQNFMAMIKTAMHEMSDVPENFLGKIQPISNTSAAALQLTFQPIIQQADMKWLMYGEGIAAINSMIVKILRVYDKSNPYLKELDGLSPSKRFENDFQVNPVFSYGFPQDKQIELNMAEQALRLRLSSRNRILNEMGINNVQELTQEINADVLAQATLDAKVAEIAQPKQPVVPEPATIPPSNGSIVKQVKAEDFFPKG